MKPENRQFYNDVLNNLQANSLAILAGAGLSKSAGYVDWKGLLRDIADDLGLSVDIESDLISLAQYNVNKIGGRSMINQKIIAEFTEDAQTTENHKILARLPIYTYWTTNYDDLIEKSLKEIKRVPDVKHAVSQLSLSKPRRDAVVYKMHGDATMPHEAVLVKDDYERYNIDKAGFVTALSGDLVSKLFVFIGFSFTDPNLDYIMTRVRLQMSGSDRHHYYFIKRVTEDDYDIKNKADLEYKQKKQAHFITDLRRFRLQPVYVDSYSEITEILCEIETLYKKRTVFIGGSAEEYGIYNRDQAQAFIHQLSSAIINKNFRIVNGFGWGVGSAVMNGALEMIHSRPDKYGEDQLIVKPFPQFKTGEKELPQLWAEYRYSMLAYAGVAIFLFGNKNRRDGPGIIEADGLIKEFEIAKAQGLFLLPVPATGYVSEILFNTLNSEGYYDNYPGLKEHIDAVATEKDPDKIISTVITIIQQVNEKK
ncbi:MAG: SIR2 family protein [Sediminibacterium sp.]